MSGSFDSSEEDPWPDSPPAEGANRSYGRIHDLNGLLLTAARPEDANVVQAMSSGYSDDQPPTFEQKHRLMQDIVGVPLVAETHEQELAVEKFFAEYARKEKGGRLPNWREVRNRVQELRQAVEADQSGHFRDKFFLRFVAWTVNGEAHESFPYTPADIHPRSRVLGTLHEGQWPGNPDEISREDIITASGEQKRLHPWLVHMIEKYAGRRQSSAVVDAKPAEEVKKRHDNRFLDYAQREMEDYRQDLNPQSRSYCGELANQLPDELPITAAENQFRNQMAPAPAPPAFSAHNALSPAECGYLISAAASLLEPLDMHFEQRYRCSDRAMIRSESIADEIFRRLASVLRPEDYRDRIPLCFSQDGQWLPLRCNECLKIVRYNKGGKFAMHRDAPWIPSPDQASIFTVIVYLNEDFRGGATALEPDDYPNGQRMMRNSDALYVLPCTGTALVFAHDMWHGGLPVESGAKWILRTEMVFQRVRTHYVDRYLHTSDESFLAAKQLYEESMAALKALRRAEFAETYQRVILAQQKAMHETVEDRCREERLLAALNDDTYGVMLDFLPDEDIVDGLLVLNKATYYATVQTSAAWERRCVAAFPSTASPLSFAVLVGVAEPEASSNDEAVEALHTDWFGLYAGQRMLKRRFCPAVLVLTTSSVYVAHHPGAPVSVQYAPYQGDLGELIHPSCITITNSNEAEKYDAPIVTSIDSCYAYMDEDPWHMNIPPCDRYHGMLKLDPKRMATTRSLPERDDRRWLYGGDSHLRGGKKDTRIKPLCKFDGSVEWSVLATSVLNVIGTIWMPLFIVGHPAMFVGEDDAVVSVRLQRHRRDAFHLLRTPALVIMHPAVVALHAATPPEAKNFGQGQFLVLFRSLLLEHYAALVDGETMQVVCTVAVEDGKPIGCDPLRLSSKLIAVDCLPQLTQKYHKGPTRDIPVAERNQMDKVAAQNAVPSWDVNAMLHALKLDPATFTDVRMMSSEELVDSGFGLSRGRLFREACVFANQ